MESKKKPMLMQLAEPEYMYTSCGCKFYVYSKEKPEKCDYCKQIFDWN